MIIRKREDEKMKKRLISLLCVLALLAAFSATASAQAPLLINNVIKGDNSVSGGPSGSPGVSDIIATGDDKVIQLPKSKSYLPSYQIMFVNASKGNSVYMYKSPWADKSNRLMDDAYHGSKVTVLANENGLSCILFTTQSNKQRAAWINSANLSWDFPGDVQSIGYDHSGGRVTYVGDAKASWSRDYFPHTSRYYTLLNTPVRNVSDFTLDYQVIERNGAQTEAVLGSRDVYVNDGSGWVEVGSFEYNAMAPIHVVVYLDSPMTLAAVATTAACAKPDTFSFRQTLLDVMVN